MKFRRLLLAGIVLGGILLVVLGIAGVLSPDRPTIFTPPTESGRRAAGNTPDDGDVEPGQAVGIGHHPLVARRVDEDLKHAIGRHP